MVYRVDRSAAKRENMAHITAEMSLPERARGILELSNIKRARFERSGWPDRMNGDKLLQSLSSIAERAELVKSHYHAGGGGDIVHPLATWRVLGRVAAVGTVLTH